MNCLDVLLIIVRPSCEMCFVKPSSARWRAALQVRGRLRKIVCSMRTMAFRPNGLLVTDRPGSYWIVTVNV